ncbi:hypothetical protein GCM10028777_02570 [Angustibacter speluncae]
MSTAQAELEQALGGVPAAYRKRLANAHTKMKVAHRAHEYDSCGVQAGKICETLIRYLQHELIGSATPFGTSLSNFSDLCKSMERVPRTAGPEEFRVLIPRALNFVYTMRNKRGMGHEGEEVDPHEADASAVVALANWCVAELIRVTSTLPMEDAQRVVDALAERELPVVWSGAGRKRVLDPQMSRKDQVLTLLYSEPDEATPVEDLCAWVEAPRLDNFKTRVIAPMHAQRIVEYDRETETVMLLPPGIAAAETLLGG